MLTPGRKFSAGSSYRYGFNSKENDKDISAGAQDYGMRISDARIGKFLSVDPLTPKYPELTPYQFASNRPIDGIDQDGLEFLKDFSSRQNTYFQGQQDALLKPKETLRAFDPSKKSFTQSWRDSKNFFASMTYHMANGIYTFPQQITRGVTGQSQISNIGGDTYSAAGIGGEKQRTNNFIDFASTIIPSAPASAVRAEIGIARQGIASAFYEKAGFAADKAFEHMEGINFSKPVEAMTLKKGTVIQQWVGEGGIGNYFITLKNGATKNLGIPNYEERSLQQYILSEDVNVLKSTAAKYKGYSGGGIQFFSVELKDKIIQKTVNQ